MFLVVDFLVIIYMVNENLWKWVGVEYFAGFYGLMNSVCHELCCSGIEFT